MKLSFLFCLLSLFVTPVFGLVPVPCEDRTWTPRDPSFTALPGARAISGSYPGGVYRFEIPEQWNGELVLWAHGFVDPATANGQDLRVANPANESFRQHLIQQGFAWAASSYRCNGYVAGIGLLDTLALKGVFTNANSGREPKRTYLTGGSLGGHVVVLGLHEFPEEFDGGLATCPAGPGEYNYLTAIGHEFERVTKLSLQDARDQAPRVLGRGPNFSELGRTLASAVISMSGGPRPFAMEGLANQLSSNVQSAAGFPERAWYRFWAPHLHGGSPDAKKLAPYEEAMPWSGKLAKPLLTMHGLGDMYVPVSLERELKRAVDQAGASSSLVQRLVRVGGHCGFSGPEMIRAFDDLVRWVRDGQRPEGDDVLGDLRDAGKKFTEPVRPGDPGTLAP